MKFRRAVDHIRHQSWTAVAIDLVIVIVGVFIGLQVSNWNEARSADARAAVFTAQLRADLREEAWGIRLLLEYNRDVLVNAERAVAGLSGRGNLSDEALLISAYRATQYKQKLRRRSTYDELTSTGSIGLIRDRTLRDTAMRVYNAPMWADVVRDGRESEYRRAFRMSLPNEIQRALAKTCGDRPIAIGDFKGIVGSLDYPCTTGLSPDDIVAAVRTLRANATLVPLLRLRIADIETRLADMTVNNREILSNLQVIADGAPQ
jgi:hypothetical protein